MSGQALLALACRGVVFAGVLIPCLQLWFGLLEEEGLGLAPSTDCMHSVETHLEVVPWDHGLLLWHRRRHRGQPQ